MLIRAATLADAAEIARLSAELGYPATLETMSARLQYLLASPRHAVLVGDGGSRLLGWIALEQRVLLEYDERVEIVGLVVDAGQRRGGIGKALVAAGEQWAATRGIAEVFVRSNVTRESSHPFYVGLGYTRSKTQHAYRRRLPVAG